MTDWDKAKLCRLLARKATTRKAAQSLYAKARYLEKKVFQNNESTQTTEHSSSITAANESHSGQLPKWFREARSSLRCIKCRRYQGTYWYTHKGGIYSRVRVMSAVRNNDLDRAKELMQTAIQLCRRCANESKNK